MSTVLMRDWGEEQSIEEIAAVTGNRPSHLSPRQKHTYKCLGGCLLSKNVPRVFSLWKVDYKPLLHRLHSPSKWGPSVLTKPMMTE